MSTPATTGPARERITRRKWEEHPTPDDARVLHIYPDLRGDRLVKPGDRAFCGHVRTKPANHPRDGILYPGAPIPGDLCVVCTNLDFRS